MLFFNSLLLHSYSPFWLCVLLSLLTYAVTALGASAVFFFKKVNQKALNLMLGFAAGVMLAAAFFSLLLPAIELSRTLGYIDFLYPAIGFFLGSLFVLLASRFFEYSTKKFSSHAKRRGALLITSITLHNIPEGLSVGVAFGAIALGIEGCDIVGASLLAIGIALQNFPEGASVSVPLRQEGLSRKKAFMFGQLSGAVEPVAAVMGFFLAMKIQAALPFALSFSAGAMIAVLATELLPESAQNKNLSCLGCSIGFVFMMILDVALG